MMTRLYVYIICVLFALPLGSTKAQQLQSSDTIIARHLRIGKGRNITEGNVVKFYMNGHDKFVDMFEDIRQAKRFIHLDYFNFRNDSIAGLLFNLLKVKASEGVEVRAMYDDFGNWSNNKPIRKKQKKALEASGIKLKVFDPIVFPWFNHIIPRDHRKIVVIDGNVAYTGGMNVADYYITGLKEVGPWHDMHMRIVGPAVNDLQYIFCEGWHEEFGETLVGSKYYPEQHGADDGDAIAIVDRHPKRAKDGIRDLYAEMINQAQRKVQIISPYFVPTHRVRQALKDAVGRGVEVEILLSEKCDEPMTPDAGHYVANNLRKRGARIWLFQGGFHHTKIMMVDGIVSTVGSANLDARSLRCDYEVNAVIFSKPTTERLIEHFEQQKKSSIEMSPYYWKSKPAGKRFLGWLGNLLTPVM